MRRRLILHETKQIYWLNVFYFLLYQRRYFLLVSELINTRKFKDLDSREITSLPDIEKVIYMARLFHHRRI